MYTLCWDDQPAFNFQNIICSKRSKGNRTSKPCQSVVSVVHPGAKPLGEAPGESINYQFKYPYYDRFDRSIRVVLTKAFKDIRFLLGLPHGERTHDNKHHARFGNGKLMGTHYF